MYKGILELKIRAFYAKIARSQIRRVAPFCTVCKNEHLLVVLTLEINK